MSKQAVYEVVVEVPDDKPVPTDLDVYQDIIGPVEKRLGTDVVVEVSGPENLRR